jgi:BirA family biotin operon repressor/biotin-[acetyl-CoA-carboxylase] ligase
VEVATTFLSRRERFERVGSTNDVVRDWLAAGTPEVCVALADEQTAGRGRNGRTWSSPPGAGLLVSLGFRPTWLAPDRVWQLAALVSLAMADAAQSVANLAAGTIGLKWPNDLVLVDGDEIRKLAGVLGETDGLGTDDPRAIIGIGVNADWPAADFPADLAPTMTSLRAASGDRPIDVDALAERFLANVEPRVEALRDGRFDAAGWTERQVTTGRDIELVRSEGSIERAIARGVDPVTGALWVTARDGRDDPRPILVGEIRHVRLAAV